MKSILIIALTFSSIFVLAQDESRKYFLEGRKEESQQNWSKAQSAYSRAIKADPENADYYYARGKLQMLLAQDSKALADIDKAVELAPNNPAMHILKAQYFVYNNLPDSAMLYVQNAAALEMTPKQQAENDLARGDVFRLLGNHQKALENYEKGLAVDTANVEGLENIALVLYHLGDQKQAAHYLQELLKVNPNIMDTYINVGYIYARIGMFIESLSYSDEALKFDPHQPIALANKAYALYKLEDFDQAESAINSSLNNHPDNPFALKTRALINLATNQNNRRVCNDLKKANRLGYDELYDDGEVDTLLREHCE